MKRTQLKFSGAATLALSTTEQYSDQIDIDELSSHDLRIQYDPDTVNDTSLNLEVVVYVSDDGMDVEEADSSWHPMAEDVSQGAGKYAPDIVTYRRPAATSLSAKRNANIGFSIGARKVRFGLTEQTTGGAAPGDAGDITVGYLSSRD